MKPIIAFALLLFQCGPESHTLLGGDAAPPADDDAVDGVYACEDAMTHAIHGTPCTGGGGCGYSPTTTDVGWTGCVGQGGVGEWMSVRGSIRRAPTSETCADALSLSAVVEGWIESVDGPCFTARTCDGRLYDLCQRDGRPGIRPDAVAMTPWTSCGPAIASARDGEPCQGALRCGGMRGGQEVVLYCDEDGVTRMIVGGGFTFTGP